MCLWLLSNPSIRCHLAGLELDTTYVVCRINEWRMGIVAIGSECDGQLWPGATDRVDLYNVHMTFDHLEYPTVDRFGQQIEVLEVEAGDVTVHDLPATIYNDAVLLIEDWNQVYHT